MTTLIHSFRLGVLTSCIGALIACGPNDPNENRIFLDETSAREDAIYNGSPTSEFPSAVALLAGNSIRCSATLITPRIVITAAHCVDITANVPVGGFSVFFGTDPSALDGGFTVPMIKTYIHPGWDPEENRYNDDIALLVLQHEPEGITPTPLFDGPLTNNDYDRAVTMVGFGHANDNNSFGIKRKVSSSIDWIQQWQVSFQGPAGTCSGDSGGPTFVEEDGVTKILSVHSTVSGLCGNFSNDVRVDAHRSGFLNPTMEDIEAILATEPEPEPEPTQEPEPEASDDDDDDDDDDGDDDAVGAGCHATGHTTSAMFLLGFFLLSPRRKLRSRR